MCTNWAINIRKPTTWSSSTLYSSSSLFIGQDNCKYFIEIIPHAAVLRHTLLFYDTRCCSTTRCRSTTRCCSTTHVAVLQHVAVLGHMLLFYDTCCAWTRFSTSATVLRRRSGSVKKYVNSSLSVASTESLFIACQQHINSSVSFRGSWVQRHTDWVSFLPKESRAWGVKIFLYVYA